MLDNDTVIKVTKLSREIVMFVPHPSPTEVFSSQEDTTPDFNAIEAGLGEQVGQNLRVVRSQLGLSQQLLAERIGVSLSQYRKYEAGKDLPRLHSALLWSIETGIPTHWLFSATGYQRWLNVPFKPAWIPILSFANDAPDWALHSVHAALTGMLGCFDDAEPLQSLQWDRQQISRHIFQEDYYRAVSEKLRKFRVRLGMSQDDAARVMGISTEAYRKYETPTKCTHFSINLIMRFWVATGTNPIELSSETPVFKYRLKQRRNFGVLLPLLEQMNKEQLNQLNTLLEVVMNMQPPQNPSRQHLN